MDRYIWERGERRILIFDRILGTDDTEGGRSRHIAACHDPDVAQKIVDALNEKQALADKQAFMRAFCQYSREEYAKLHAGGRL